MSVVYMLKKRDVYESKRLNVQEHTVNAGADTPLIYPVIEYAGDSVSVCIQNSIGDVLICKEHKYALGRTVLALPSGQIDEGETPFDAAQREVLEETGFLIDNIKIIGQTYPIPANSKLCQYMVLATLSGKAKRRPEAGEESITTHWATLDEAVQLVLNGGMVQRPFGHDLAAIQTFAKYAQVTHAWR